MRDPLAHIGSRKIQFPHCAEERGDVSIQNLRGRGGATRYLRPHKYYAATVPVFRPSFANKLSIPGADGVGMHAEVGAQSSRVLGRRSPECRSPLRMKPDHLRDELAIGPEEGLRYRGKTTISRGPRRITRQS